MYKILGCKTMDKNETMPWKFERTMEKIPDRTFAVLEAITEGRRLTILRAMMDEPLSYREVEKMLGRPSGECYRIVISPLCNANLIHVVEKRRVGRKRTRDYYGLTDYGRRVMDVLMEQRTAPEEETKCPKP